MPYSLHQSASWDSDPGLLEMLEGGPALISWFGFSPDFHDATVSRIEFSGRKGVIEIEAFRMTSETDERGYFILDRHILVSLHLSGITDIVIACNPSPQILELGIRRLNSEREIPQDIAAKIGDLEIAFDDVCGGHGSIYVKEIEFALKPTPSPAITSL